MHKYVTIMHTRVSVYDTYICMIYTHTCVHGRALFQKCLCVRTRTYVERQSGRVGTGKGEVGGGVKYAPLWKEDFPVD